jgi:hypothetical protein
LYRNGKKTERRAWKFLAATNFCQDDARRRSVFCNEPRDVYAADVMYHKNCSNKYILQSSREMEKINRYDKKADESIEDKQVVVKVF